MVLTMKNCIWIHAQLVSFRLCQNCGKERWEFGCTMELISSVLSCMKYVKGFLSRVSTCARLTLSFWDHLCVEDLVNY